MPSVNFICSLILKDSCIIILKEVTKIFLYHFPDFNLPFQYHEYKEYLTYYWFTYKYLNKAYKYRKK